MYVPICVLNPKIDTKQHSKHKLAHTFHKSYRLDCAMHRLFSNKPQTGISEQLNRNTQTILHILWMICALALATLQRNLRNIDKSYTNYSIYSKNIPISSNCPNAYSRQKKSSSSDSM